LPPAWNMGPLCMDFSASSEIWNFFNSDSFVVETPVGTYNQTNVPPKFSLHQNDPYPFNPTTTISYSLSEQTAINLTVFDIRGQEVLTLQEATKSPGNYEVQWNG